MSPKLIQQLEQAASRALEVSNEMREIVRKARDDGFDVSAQLQITAKRCPVQERESLVTDSWLESLFKLEDRRRA